MLKWVAIPFSRGSSQSKDRTQVGKDSDAGRDWGQAAAFSRYDGDLSLPLELALGSPNFPSGCEGKLGVALERKD